AARCSARRRPGSFVADVFNSRARGESVQFDRRRNDLVSVVEEQSRPETMPRGLVEPDLHKEPIGLSSLELLRNRNLPLVVLSFDAELSRILVARRTRYALPILVVDPNHGPELYGARFAFAVNRLRVVLELAAKQRRPALKRTEERPSRRGKLRGGECALDT